MFLRTFLYNRSFNSSLDFLQRAYSKIQSYIYKYLKFILWCFEISIGKLSRSSVSLQSFVILSSEGNKVIGFQKDLYKDMLKKTSWFC